MIMLRTTLFMIALLWTGTVRGAVLSLRQKPTNPNNSTTFQFGSTSTPMRGVNAGGWYVSLFPSHMMVMLQADKQASPRSRSNTNIKLTEAMDNSLFIRK